jgi:hypothetical protein
MYISKLLLYVEGLWQVKAILHNDTMCHCELIVPGFEFNKIKLAEPCIIKILKEKIARVDKGIKDNRDNMTITTSQVSAVIKTYLKNTKDRLENASNHPRNPEDDRDEVTVSDDAKKILFERIGKRVVEKLKNEMAQNY